MIATITRTTRIRPETCCVCGVIFGMADDHMAQRRRDGQRFYCPNGHSQYYTETDTDRLEKANARARHLEDQLQASKAEAEQTRRALLRDRSRFANGVCPCCNRSFANVRRHIASKHPGYDVTKVEQGHAASYRCSCSRRFDTYHGLRVHQGRSSWGRHDTVIGR